MTRLPLALACLLSALTASIASAQSYQQPYSMYGPGMPSGGMYPGYGQGQAYGQPMGQPMMQPYPSQAAMEQGWGGQGMASQAMYGPPPGGFPSGGNPGPLPHYSGRAAPPMKLPPGVHAENGVLYYDGKAYADSNYSQPSPFYPVRRADCETVEQSGSMPGGMYQQPGYSGMQGQGPMYDGEGGGAACNGNCNGACNGDCNGACGNCYGNGRGIFDVFGRPRNALNPFPGKYGYVWTAGFDVLALTRDAGTNRPLVLDSNTGATLFNSNAFGFDFEPGGRAFLSLMGPSGIQYQATYMKLATLVADNTVFGNNNLQIPPPLSSATVTMFDADQMNFRYLSEIQGAEANIIYPFGNFQLLAGFRYLEIDEQITLTSFDVDAGTGTFTANSFNNLYGGQIGILGQWQAFGLVDFDFFAKFGVFENYAQEHQVLNDPIFFRDTAGHHSEAAYVTELGAQIVVPLGPSFSFHVGYDVFFIDRIALAPDQYDFNVGTVSDGTRVNPRGDMVLQGVNLGLKVVW
jgi:hypothetical protein